MKTQETYLLQHLMLRQVIMNRPGHNLIQQYEDRPCLVWWKLFIAFTFLLFTITVVSAQDYETDQLKVAITTHKAPPPIPDYIQPESPGDGYYWIPGYWSLSTDDYYWVPGTWVLPPADNLLWTPGYWGFENDLYGWYPGYWGDEVGYYGGINYGFGYFGSGFYGGRWDRNRFMYNTLVWRVGKNVHNTYVENVNISHNNTNRASFNGSGGVEYRPNEHEMKTIAHRVPANVIQQNHEVNMSKEKGQFMKTNPKPAVHSMSTPGGQRFNESGLQTKGSMGRNELKGDIRGGAGRAMQGGGERKGGKR